VLGWGSPSGARAAAEAKRTPVASELQPYRLGSTSVKGRLSAAAAAVADRDQALKTKEVAHAQLEADLAKRIAELDRRVESYRAALAG
jgi:hypothetical protein